MTTVEHIGAILQNYGGLESNIPVLHPYWKLVNSFRAGLLDVTPDEYNPIPQPQAPPANAQDKIKLAALRKLCRDALRDFGRESNIPFTHDYWFAMNQIKAIERDPE